MSKNKRILLLGAAALLVLGLINAFFVRRDHPEARLIQKIDSTGSRFTEHVMNESRRRDMRQHPVQYEGQKK